LDNTDILLIYENREKCNIYSFIVDTCSNVYFRICFAPIIAKGACANNPEKMQPTIEDICSLLLFLYVFAVLNTLHSFFSCCGIKFFEIFYILVFAPAIIQGNRMNVGRALHFLCSILKLKSLDGRLKFKIGLSPPRELG
jgi:putative peptidoglycan lipid II flippase